MVKVWAGGLWRRSGVMWFSMGSFKKHVLSAGKALGPTMREAKGMNEADLAPAPWSSQFYLLRSR